MRYYFFRCFGINEFYVIIDLVQESKSIVDRLEHIF